MTEDIVLMLMSVLMLGLATAFPLLLIWLLARGAFLAVKGRPRFTPEERRALIEAERPKVREARRSVLAAALILALVGGVAARRLLLS